MPKYLVDYLSLSRNSLITLLCLSCLACSSEVNLTADEYLALAETATSENRPKDAIIQAKNAFQIDSRSTAARWILARNYLLLREGNQAASELDKLVEAEFQHPDLEAAILDSMLLRGQYAEVVNRATKFDLKPIELVLRGEAQLALSDIQIGPNSASTRSGYLGLAQHAFDQALEEDQNLTRARLGLVRIAFRRSEFGKANALLDSVSRIDPNNSELWNLRGILHQSQEEYAKAEAAYRSAAKISPYDLVPQMNLARVLLLNNKSKKAGDVLDSLMREHPAMPTLSFLRAVAYLQDNNENDAALVLQNVVEYFPNYVDAQLLLGRILLSQGHIGQAEIAIETVLSIYPAHEKALELITKVRARSGDKKKSGEDGKEGYADAIGLGGRADLPIADSANIQKQQMLADQQYQRTGVFLSKPKSEQITTLRSMFDTGDFQGVSDLAFAATAANPDDPDFYHWMGRSARARGQIKNAKTYFNIALKRSPNHIPSLLSAADLEFRFGDHDISREQFDRVLRLESQHKLAVLGLARLDLVAGDWQGAQSRVSSLPEDIDVLYVHAEIAKFRGQLGNQIDALNKIIGIDPTLLDPRILIAKTLVAEKRYTEAEGVLVDALLLENDHPGTLLLLAETHFHLGQTERSFNSVADLAKAHPDNLEVLRALGVAELRQDNPTVALTIFERALKLDPDNVPILQSMASTQHGLKQFDESRQLSEKILKLDPNNPVAHRYVGDIALLAGDKSMATNSYRKALESSDDSRLAESIYLHARDIGDLATARSILRAWLEDHPEDDYVRSLIAVDQQMSGKLADAISGFEKALEANPNNVTALNDLAWMYHQTDHPRALELAERAFQISSDNPAVIDTLAWILLDQGDAERALELLTFAISRASNSGDIRYHYAAALAATGDKTNARIEIEHALANPNLRDRNGAQAVLQALADDE